MNSHSLGQLVNEAVRIKPSTVQSEPKAAHVTFAEMFWESLSSPPDQQQVVEELNKIMNVLLTHPKRDTKAERAVWFMSFVFGRLLDSPDETQRSSANAFLNILCDRSRCENKTVRFRCCQFLKTVLELLPDQAEIDEDVAATIYAAALERIRDKSQDVRTQALLALDRFKVPGDNGSHENDQVTAAYLLSLRTDPHPNPRAAILICLPVAAKAVEAIVERTKDQSETVRIAALRTILCKLDPAKLGERACGDVAINGLTDRSELVRKLAKQTVLNWLDDHFQKNVEALFRSFKYQTHAQAFSLVMDVVLSHRMGTVSLLTAPSIVEMSNHDSFFWKTLVCGCKRKGDELARREDENSQTAFDFLDKVLPQTVQEFILQFDTLLRAKKTYQCCHLLEILAQCYKFTDETDHQLGCQLYDRLCGIPVGKDLNDWYKTVILFGKAIWTDTRDFVSSTLRALKDLDSNPDSAHFYHWLRLAVCMLREIPLRTSSIASEGIESYTVMDVMSQLRSCACQGNANERWIIEGTGISLALQFDHECLSILWNALESDLEDVAVAAVESFCTLGMVYGVRRLDKKKDHQVVQTPLPSIWTCRIFEEIPGEVSLPIHFMNLLHWDRNLTRTLRSSLTQTMSKFLILNHSRQDTGMGIGECVQCLCPLVAMFVFDQDEEYHSPEIQQFLKIFFDRFARSHVLNQYTIRCGFVPILRYCLGLAGEWRISSTPAIRFLANLLIAPIRDGDLKTSRVLARTNCELVCVLLMEIAATPSGFAASKNYVSALWKVIMEIKIDGSEEIDRIRVLNLLDDLVSRSKAHNKNPNQLKQRLSLEETQQPVDAFRLEHLKSDLDKYMSQLGTHPFEDEESDDD